MKNFLEELNIFALRELARRVGVSSPTSKKKEQLIENIISIQSGETQPIHAKTKQGRPPKNYGYNLNIIDDMCLNNSRSVSFKQDVQSYDDADVETAAGYIELINNNSAFLWVNKNNKFINYFVTSDVIKGLNLKTADRVVAKLNVNNNQTTVGEIYNVNGCPKEKYNSNRVDYEDIEHVVQTKKLKFNNSDYDNLELNMGENTYVYGANNKQNTDTIIKIMNDCACEYKIYVNVSITEKNKVFLNKIQFAEKFVANLTDDLEMSRRVLTLAIERAKRLIENGDDVLVVVDDMLSVSSVDKENLIFTKNLVAITKQAKKQGSITLLSVMPNKTLTQIEKLADKRLYVVENGVKVEE